jgi:hypothetical protein
MKRYEANGWLKFTEEDEFDNGCKPGSGSATEGRDVFTDETIPGLLAKLQAFAGSDSPEDVLLDSCDETGRVDVQVMEREDGFTAGPADVDAWKAGRRRLWLARYSFRVEAVERAPVRLTEAEPA